MELTFSDCHNGAGCISMEPHTDTHDAVQSVAGNVTWFNEFIPVVDGCTKRFAEVLLWLCHILGLCCAVVGEFVMYVGGKLASPPNLLTIYVHGLHHTNLSPEIL
jgi:hypothetical protein